MERLHRWWLLRTKVEEKWRECFRSLLGNNGKRLLMGCTVHFKLAKNVALIHFIPTLCCFSIFFNSSLSSSNVGLEAGSFCQHCSIISYLERQKVMERSNLFKLRNSCIANIKVYKREIESIVTAYHPYVLVVASCIVAEGVQQSFCRPYEGMGTHLKNSNNYGWND